MAAVALHAVCFNGNTVKIDRADELIFGHYCHKLALRTDLVLSKRVYRRVLYYHLIARVRHIYNNQIKAAKLGSFSDFCGNGRVALYRNVGGICAVSTIIIRYSAVNGGCAVIFRRGNGHLDLGVVLDLYGERVSRSVKCFFHTISEADSYRAYFPVSEALAQFVGYVYLNVLLIVRRVYQQVYGFIAACSQMIFTVRRNVDLLPI